MLFSNIGRHLESPILNLHNPTSDSVSATSKILVLVSENITRHRWSVCIKIFIRLDSISVKQIINCFWVFIGLTSSDFTFKSVSNYYHIIRWRSVVHYLLFLIKSKKLNFFKPIFLQIFCFQNGFQMAFLTEHEGVLLLMMRRWGVDKGHTLKRDCCSIKLFVMKAKIFQYRLYFALSDDLKKLVLIKTAKNLGN